MADKTYSQLSDELEKILDWFEKSDVDLDMALKKFERGQKIIELLNKRLKAVENKVIKIKIGH